MPVTAGYVSNPYQAFGDPDIPSPYNTYSQWTAADYGMLATSALLESTFNVLPAPASGLIWAFAMRPETSGAVTKIIMNLATNAVTSTGANQVGLHDSNGILLSSATVDPFTGGTGNKQITLPSTTVAAGSTYYVTLLGHYSSAPQWYGVNALALQGALAAPYRAMQIAGTGYVTIPGAFTPSAGTIITNLLLIGLA